MSKLHRTLNRRRQASICPKFSNLIQSVSALEQAEMPISPSTNTRATNSPLSGKQVDSLFQSQDSQKKKNMIVLKPIKSRSHTIIDTKLLRADQRKIRVQRISKDINSKKLLELKDVYLNLIKHLPKNLKKTNTLKTKFSGRCIDNQVFFIETPTKTTPNNEPVSVRKHIVDQLVAKRKNAIPLINLKNCASNIGFHQEFMRNADNFSNSWREAIRQGR